MKSPFSKLAILLTNLGIGPDTIHFDPSRTTKFICRKQKRPHGPVLYYGHAKTPVKDPEQGNLYLAAIMKRVKDAKGRKRRVPIHATLVKSQKEAKEIALLWLAQAKGIDTTNCNAGKMSREQRSAILAQLGAAKVRLRLVGPAPVTAPDSQADVTEIATIPESQVAEHSTQHITEPVPAESSQAADAAKKAGSRSQHGSSHASRSLYGVSWANLP